MKNAKKIKRKYDGNIQSMMTHRQLVLAKFKHHKLAIGALVLLILMYTLCIFSDFFAPYAPNERFTEFSSMPPQKLHFIDESSGKWIGPFVYGVKSSRDPDTLQKKYIENQEQINKVELFHRGKPYKILGIIETDIHLVGVKEGTLCLMGTDSMGRDLLSRILNGGRLSLSIGLVGVFLSMLLGLLLGGIAGFYGGIADSCIMRVVDLFMSLPTIPLWMGLAAAVPRDWSTIQTYFAITIILSFFGWTNIARVVRGKFLSLREEDYVLAARLGGAGDFYIIRAHLIPSFISYIIVSLTLSIPGMIIGETTLSFLGLGLQAPAVSWGVLLRDAQNFRSIATMPWLLLPSIFVVITVLSFNFIGDGLRDAADPYSN